jgi:WD40 repeat protein
VLAALLGLAAGTMLRADEPRPRSALKGVGDPDRCVAFSPDGKSLASGSSDGTVSLWDVATGRRRAILKEHPGQVWCVAFSRDGKSLAAGTSGAEDSHGEVRLWDPATGRLNASLKGHTCEVQALAFSPDGKTLATGGGDEGLDDAQVVQGEDDEDRLEAGREARARPGEAKLWDLATGRTRFILEVRADLFESLAFSPDGRWLISGSRDGTVSLWDVQSGKLRSTFRGHSQGVVFLNFLVGGQRIVTGSRDGTAKLWDFPVKQRSTVIKADEDSGQCWALSPDGRTLASGSFVGGAVTLWDVASGERRGTLKGLGQTVEAVAFAPDGRTLASAENQGGVKLWDVDPQRFRDR